MIFLFFAAVLSTISINLFSLNFSIQGMNRSIIFAPIEIMYSNITLNEDEPKLVKEKLMSNLTNYYTKSLSRYCKSFTSDFYFYNLEDESMCLEDNCNGFEVRINAKLPLNYSYYRAMYYELVRS